MDSCTALMPKQVKPAGLQDAVCSSTLLPARLCPTCSRAPIFTFCVTHRVGLYPVEVKPAGSQSAIGCVVDGQARCDLQQCCSQPSVHSHEPLISYNGAQGMCYPGVVL